MGSIPRVPAKPPGGRAGRNSCYRSADILFRLRLANPAEADKNVRAPFAFLHVVGNCELRPAAGQAQRIGIGGSPYPGL